MASLIGVTGATGEIGGRVARTLVAKGHRVRLLVRDATRAPKLDGVEVAEIEYSDRDLSVDALRGVNSLLMVSATESPERIRDHETFISAAKTAGISQVVYTSFFGAAPQATFTFARDHYATEQLLRGSGMHWTFLRDNFYIEVFQHFANDDGELLGPAGDGRVSAVARADVAAVASTVLDNPAAHENVTYDLTGPAALTLTEIAEVLSKHTGRTITYREETVEEAYESRKKWPAEKWQYDAWVSTYAAIASGELSEVSDDVEKVTGRKPLSFEQVYPPLA